MTKHILVVDDDAEVREILGEMLETGGYRVSLVNNGAEMRLFLASDKSVDGIVLDALMPGEDSADLALHAKALRLPLIMISGSNEKVLFAADNNLQMLRKPFGVSALIEAVEKAFASGVHGQRDA